MYRHVLVLVALAAAPAVSFAASAPVPLSNATAANPPTNPETARPSGAGTTSAPAADHAALAAAAAQGWINLLRDRALSDWQRIALPPEAPLNDRNPWRYDPATGILHCDGTGLHEMLLHRAERGDGIFSVEWRYSGTPAQPSAGIFVRTKPDNSVWHQAELAPNSLGMLLGANPGADGTATRFNHGRRRPDLLRKAGEWNVMELVCVGSRVMLHFNGALTAELRECAIAQGLVGLEAEGAPIEFRAVRFKPLP